MSPPHNIWIWLQAWFPNENRLTFLAYSVIFLGELKKSTRVASLNWICSYAFSMQPAISSLQLKRSALVKVIFKGQSCIFNDVLYTSTLLWHNTVKWSCFFSRVHSTNQETLKIRQRQERCCLKRCLNCHLFHICSG